jgi:CRP-like cAMP-binding protein
MRKVLYLLGELNDADVEWLLANGTRQAVPPGTALIVEGRPAGALFIVLDGTLVATVAALGAAEVERLVCGAVAGEMSFVDGRPPSATVRAQDAAVVLAVAHTTLSAKLAADPAFAARFYKALALFLSDRLRGKVEMLAGEQVQLDPDIVDADELDPVVLDHVYLAGTRFDRMLKRLMAG